MCAELVRFVNRELSGKVNLTMAQLSLVKKWAREVPIREQKAYLEVLEGLNGQGLLLYLSKIVPEFPSGGGSNRSRRT